MPGVDLREVQDILDQLEQVLGAVPDVVEEVRLLRLCEVAIAHQRSETEDRIHGRSQLVACIGEEGGPGRERVLELACSVLDLLLEVLACLLLSSDELVQTRTELA